MSKKSRKRRLEGKGHLSTSDWEQQHILPDEIKREIVSMWEIPQISQFLHLTKDALNLTHLSVYEMERMLLMPRASKQLANIMTALLSSPVAKTKVKKVPPMPYQFWTNILTHKIKGWFKVYDGKRRDSVKVLEILGVEPEFWKIFPNESVLDDKDFDELTFRQRVWLVKTVCDTVMHSRKSVQEELAKQPWEDQFELSLGTDRDGARYVYFPQFIKTDLRIYRYCLDNTILSTQPVGEKVSKDSGDEGKTECSRITKKWTRRRGDSEYSDSEVSREASTDCNTSRTDCLANEDTNLSSTSTCSNNNHMEWEIITRKRSRSSSKISEVSTSSSEKQRRITRSSGYDSTTSIDSANETKYSQKMFKGFLNKNSGKSNIEIISGLINNLKSDDMDDKVTPTNSELNSRFDTTQRINTLPSSSKTDDEKLNEIIDAENSKLNDRQVSISKSDDEKLHETVHRVKTRSQSKKNVEELINEDETIELETEESSNVKDISLNGLRILLEKDALHSELCLSKLTETEYNLRKSKKCEIDNSTPETNWFDEMLTDLSVSDFQLVADSVESLRLLISSFSTGTDDDNIDKKTDTDDIEVPASSEMKLVEKLKELLSSVENMKSNLRDSMKKARGKLQKEWTNFKDGSVEDQDLPSDSGLGSNWWILGSQGCPLSTSRESTLQMLSQSTISTLSPRSAQRTAESSQNSESESENTKQQSPDAKESQTAGTHKNKEKGHRTEGTIVEIENTKKPQEEDHQTKRVLRARGVSSYTEQFSSDDEIEEDKLDAWSDVEAIYAAPGTQADTSSANTDARDRHDDNPSTEEDSDQDWILPSSRKRKHKRPSATRRLKSFQHKIQNIKVGTMEKSASGNIVYHIARMSNIEKSKVKESIPRRIHRSLNRQISVTPTKPVENMTIVKNEPIEETTKQADIELKVESIDCVHSELDIKEEGPFNDSTMNVYDDNYGSAVPQNYVMFNAAPTPMNYYLVQPNPGAPCVTTHAAIVQSAPFVSAVVPPIQQSYYVQDGQSYIIPNAPATLVTSQIASFQPQGPHMMEPQQFVTAPSYVPCMVASTTQPQIQPHFQQAYVTTPVQPPTSVRALPPVFHEKSQQTPPGSLDKGNSCVKSLGKTVDSRKDPLAVRVNFRNPHGAVIRSTMPIRNPRPRTGPHSGRLVAPIGPRQQQPPNAQAKHTQSNDSEQKTTSLIVLSDSDDEIEMIITKNTESEKDTERTKLTSQVQTSIERQAPRITSDIQIPPSKNILPPQILERINQGGISITPVKQSSIQRSDADSTANYATNTNTNTQLVVVVNETGGHYALSLPNGSKLILTPEQVAQIRASNGGKLIL